MTEHRSYKLYFSKNIVGNQVTEVPRAKTFTIHPLLDRSTYQNHKIFVPLSMFPNIFSLFLSCNYFLHFQT